MYFACPEHSERALDDAVEETGEPPLMEKMEEKHSSTTCSYCTEKAVYKMKGKPQRQV
ncbi:CxxH/CxxC protein [Salibacterium sp. K-3]